MATPNNALWNLTSFVNPNVSDGVTYLNLIYAGYRIAGITIAPGRNRSQTDLNEGQAVLNSMLDSWQAERLLVYAEVRTLFSLQANKNTYSIGQNAGNDWTAQRPLRIERAGYIFTNTTPNIEIPFKILNDQEWQALSPKLLQSTNPYLLYYEPLVPNGLVNLWPVPTDISQVSQVALYLWQQILQCSDPTVQLFLPPGYQNAIEYNLAVELAARFPARQKLSPWSMSHAADAKRKCKNMNAVPLYMQTEAANRGRIANGRGRYNPITNSWIYP